MHSGEPSSMDPSAQRRKKGRKRKKKSANEPTTSKAPGEDVVNVSTSRWFTQMFKPGEPMLPKHKLSALSVEIQLLHKGVVARSGKGEMYYTTNVIESLGYVDEYPADKIYLGFDIVINDNIFYVDLIKPSLMRLWSLWHATNPLLQNEEVGFLEPYLMHWFNVNSDKGQRLIMTYLHKTILHSPRHKHNFIVPYFETYVHTFMLVHIHLPTSISISFMLHC